MQVFACKQKPFCLQPKGLLLISKKPFACSQKLQIEKFCTANQKVLYRKTNRFIPQFYTDEVDKHVAED